jgi:hypothetical protein
MGSPVAYPPPAAGRLGLLRSFTCRRCGQLVFCENVACLRCGAPPGVVPEARELATVGAVEPGETPGDAHAMTASAGPAGAGWQRCAAEMTADCNWLVPAGPPALCRTTRAEDPERGLAGAGR